MTKLNDLIMPKLGLTMTEGMIAEWLVGPGDQVNLGDIMFVVETDKVATEIPADAEGVIGEILVEVGEVVPVGSVIGRWTGPAQGVQADLEEKIESDTNALSAVTTASNNSEVPAQRTAENKRLVVTPYARRLASEFSVDLNMLPKNDHNQRIRAKDVRQYLNDLDKQIEVKNQHQSQLEVDSVSNQQAAVLPVSALVRVMAERMVEAKQVPHFYLSSEAEVSQLLELRNQLNQNASDIKLTLNHFVIAAVARALELIPQQNRIWTDDGIIQFQQIDLGVAVSTEKGLMAPVLRNLGNRTLDDIASISNKVIQRTRDGQLQHDDLAGGAITISNAGMFDVTYMTPIINPPHSAIIGVGSIREVFRPNKKGKPCLKKEMGLVMAADHRLHDGATGLVFLNCVIDLLQNPYKLLRPVNSGTFQG